MTATRESDLPLVTTTSTPSLSRFRPTVSAEVGRTYASWLSLVWVALIAAPVAWTATKDAVFAYPLSAFATAMESPVSVVLPLIAVGLYLVRFSRELSDRFVVNVRARLDVRRYLGTKAAATAATAFLFFFIYAFVAFVAMVYVLPPTGALRFDPTGSVAADHFARFSELWSVSPLLYGLVYAVWCGLNGVVWALVGFIAVLLVPNKLLALAVPVASVLLLSVAANLVGFDLLAPYTLWILFGYIQAPPWTALAPMAVLLAAVTVGAVLVVNRSATLAAVQ